MQINWCVGLIGMPIADSLPKPVCNMTTYNTVKCSRFIHILQTEDDSGGRSLCLFLPYGLLTFKIIYPFLFTFEC